VPNVMQAARQRVLESVFDSLPVGVAVATADAIVDVNSLFLQLVGLTREQALSHSAQELLGDAEDVEVGGRWLRVSASPIEGPGGGQELTAYAVVEVTALRKQALLDPVTGLPNRHLLLDRLEQCLVHGHRTGMQTAVLFVDLDGFKSVNDRAGHAAGDLVLAEAGRRIAAVARESDTVGRWAGDEFLVVCQQVRTLGDAAVVATRIRDVCAQPFTVGGHSFQLGASVGLASTRSSTDSTALLEQADASMYAQKKARNPAGTASSQN
jgi:diguanylate cyclase (GGDEF)-like protein